MKTTVTAIETPFLTIEPGKVGLVSYAWTAFCGDAPFYRTKIYWYFGAAIRPEAARCDDFWTVTIEGRPPSRVSVDGGSLFASPPVASVAPAPAGLLLPSMPEIHWKPDMRD